MKTRGLRWDIWPWCALVFTVILIVVLGLVLTLGPLPTTLINQSQTLLAMHIVTMPFDLPYDGDVTVKVNVLHGSPMDVCMTKDNAPGQIWLHTLQEFDASKTTSYIRTQRLVRGHYYLAIRDHLGGVISPGFPPPNSDLSINVHLNP